jgi:predicted flap endonuclease-1-like 5' DNA nuclease
MTLIFGLLVGLLGLAIGFVVAWALGVGSFTGLIIGLLLAVAGAIIGFVAEWLIDVAYRRNRELERQLEERGEPTMASLALGMPVASGDAGDGIATQTLSEYLHEREEELAKLRESLAAADVRLDSLRDEFDAYQQSHPDDLTVIKGIGSVFQWKLRDAGVNTYRQLAEADPAKLRRMLDVKEWQRVEVEAWIEQAKDWAQRG